MIPFTFKNFVWQSDFMGDECGYPDVNVVGFYDYKAEDGYTYTFLIDVENSHILEITRMDEDDEK